MSSILIVEDEVLTSEYLEFVLQEAGYEAVPASSAEEAITILEPRDDVDLVIIDVNLPSGVKGLQLAALVRDRRPAINIIVVTGDSAPRSEEAVLTNANSPVLQRSLERSALVEAVEQLTRALDLIGTLPATAVLSPGRDPSGHL
jgi:two-component system, response regulator PdtaR